MSRKNNNHKKEANRKNPITQDRKKNYGKKMGLNQNHRDEEEKYWDNYLSEMGIPFGPDGTPLGI